MNFKKIADTSFKKHVAGTNLHKKARNLKTITLIQ